MSPYATKRPASSKLYALQVVRAIAAILVCWGHLLFEASNRHIDVLQGYGDRIKGLGAVGVDLFFVLSGLVVSLSAARKPEAGTFLRRRLLRILPFYWSAAAFYVVVSSLCSRGLTKAQLLYLPFLLPNPVKPNNTPPYPSSWTLVNELFFYFCLYLGLRINASRARTVCAGIVLAWVVGNLAVSGLMHRSVAFLDYYGCPIALEFLFGMAIGVLLERRRLSTGLAYAAISVGVTALAATAIVGFGLIYDATLIKVRVDLSSLRVLVWGVPAALIVLGAASLPWQPRTRLGLGLVYLGDACYSIYLLQWLPITYFDSALSASARVLGGDLTILLFLVVTVAWGALVYRFVEKPLTAYVTTAFFGRKPKNAPPLADAGIASAIPKR